MRRFSLLLFFASATTVHAGLYDPANPPLFRFVDGVVQPLSFEPGNQGEFAVRYSTAGNWRDDNPNRKNDDRAALEKKIAAFKPDGASPAQVAGQAADLIRIGRPEKAINLLQPLSRGRNASFVVLMNLAHAYAVTGDWSAALRTHDVGLDADPAADLPKWTAEQRAWAMRIEKTAYRAWLRWNLQNPKPTPETQRPLPLFDKEPPADAIAVAQQLCVWHPGDTNLYWLLAELYAAADQPRQAQTILNLCASTRNYSNRAVLMAKRTAINEIVANLPAEKPPDVPPGDDGLPSLKTVLTIAAIVGPIVLAMLYFQIRRLRK
jgi:hypothetical protein